MAINTTKTSDDQAKRSMDGSNSHSHQDATSADPEGPSNDRMSQNRPRRSKNVSFQEEVIIPSESYDPENPLPYFLAQEAKHTSAAGVTAMKDRAAMEEYRVADVENLLSCKSIFCWSLLTIVLVGGSLVAVAMTVDWDATTTDDAATGGSP
ncbi:unnamed protein product [Cylindrotheca closterium]|uniref:Uncharacterized protein n=1 Tax=Cylindrotheca closterium TaxID=2856 RepID=A0AAD2FN88_9STRA|nr:unnamed protein product [Cylindrotheca closterium]